MIALPVEPIRNRYPATGTQTSAEPTAGSSDRKIISAPQSSAPLIPRSQNATPPMVPWITAITMLPLTVARTTAVNLSISARL